MKKPLNYFGFAFNEDMIKDKRHSEWMSQIKTRGFDETELWNLDMTIIHFILPRLKAFAKDISAYPANLKSLSKWNNKLNKMIKAFELLSQDDCDEIEGHYSKELADKNNKIINQGLGIFANYLTALWV